MSSDEASESLSPVLCSECRYAAVNEFNFESMMVVSILRPLESPAMVVCASGLVLDTAMWLGDGNCDSTICCYSTRAYSVCQPVLQRINA